MLLNHFAKRVLLFVACLFFFNALNAQQDCPFMRVSIANDGWVACDNAVCRIRICNEGSQTAANARVEVVLPPALGFISSSIPPTLIINNRYFFNLGNFAAGNCLDFSITVAVDCDLAQGSAVCLIANAIPRGCPATAPGWDGSDLRVQGACFGVDSMTFTVHNQGINAMASAVNYLITEDHLMRGQGIVPIIMPTDSFVIPVYNPAGKTYTFQTMQTPGHPFSEPISVSVEGCGGPPGSTGYLLQYPQHNGDVHSDTYCDVVSAGINGMDKSGFPLGYGTEHWIDRATKLDYRIRFQNTGATTVQTVTLVDTLSDWLDLSTFRAGVASHLYTVSIQNQVLTVVLPSAQLPPASVNEPASRGFFSFHIGVKPDAPNGTIIENTARVRLDNHPPVQTDTTLHRLGENFITLHVLDIPDYDQLSVQIRPNPMGESAAFIFSGTDAEGPVLLQLFDPAGRLVRTMETRDGQLVLERHGLAAGFYFFRCQSRSGGWVGGKLVVTR